MAKEKKKSFIKKFFGEFKTFITRGNVIDLSVGVIVGGAFTAIVNGLGNYILKPIINWFIALILGTNSLEGIYTYLKWTHILDEAGLPTNQVDLANSIYIDWGSFINAIINFLIIAFVLFVIVKAINSVNQASAKLQDKKLRIELKKSKGLKLTKKEIKFLEEETKKAEEARLSEEEQAKKEAEEANKLTRSEELLTEIVKLLKDKQ